jgi:prepilin-type N-terminal cleavage/methylation domain-containing protein
MNRRQRSQGFTLIELLIVLVIIVMLITVLLTVVEIRHRTLIRSAVVILRANINACTKLAAMSPKERAAILFRPTDSDYTTYIISSDIQKPKTYNLPPGTKLINTNGFIINHMLRIGLQGTFLDEFGNAVTSPNPGIISITSPETTKVYKLIVYPDTGVIDIK